MSLIFQKNSELAWHKVTGGATSTRISLKGWPDNYVYAVSAEQEIKCAGQMKSASSGMVFYSHCVYDKDKSKCGPFWPNV